MTHDRRPVPLSLCPSVTETAGESLHREEWVKPEKVHSMIHSWMRDQVNTNAPG